MKKEILNVEVIEKEKYEELKLKFEKGESDE